MNSGRPGLSPDIQISLRTVRGRCRCDPVSANPGSYVGGRPNGRNWRNRRLRPKTAFSRFPRVHRPDLEGQQRVDSDPSITGFKPAPSVNSIHQDGRWLGVRVAEPVPLISRLFTISHVHVMFYFVRIWAANDAEAAERASGFPRDGEQAGASVDSCPAAARASGQGGGGPGNPSQAIENARFGKGNERKCKCRKGNSALG